jgi:hypothetical protein
VAAARFIFIPLTPCPPEYFVPWTLRRYEAVDRDPFVISTIVVADEVPTPIFPAKYAFPVVVAPPDIVSPVVCVPPPIVVDVENDLQLFEKDPHL